jgi:penicillin amidase
MTEDTILPPRRLWPKRLFFSLAVLLALLGTGGGTAYYVAFLRPMPLYEGRAALPGLEKTVDVLRDAHGVPHIFAHSREDALRALGYVHAGERFFQMEMQRRAGQGRLAEVVGDDMLAADKLTRTLGLYRLAQSGFLSMSPEAQGLFRAYAGGVNAWMEAHRDRMPPEFRLLGIRPEPWQPADSVVWGKLMALQLSKNMELERLRARLAAKWPPAKWQLLFPDRLGDTPVTTAPRLIRQSDAGAVCGSPPLEGGDGGWGVPKASTAGICGTPPLPPFLSREEESGQRLRRGWAENPYRSGSGSASELLAGVTMLDHGASNEWAIAGSRTASGKPILANDPHLGLEAPILWYLARVVTPDDDLKGATVPGLPAVLLGQNNHIAWGFTTTGSDVQDLFVETLDGNDPAFYLTPGGDKARFTTREEIVRVKGKPDVKLTVRSTRHGPVLSDIDPELADRAGPGKVMALAFTGLGAEDRTAEALLRLNRAGNWQEFREAMRLYEAPPQNVAYADTDGHIGFFAPGFVPVRKKGNGTMPADGASGDFDWVGMIPFTQMPQLYDPPAGYFFNANNAIVGPGFPYRLGVDWEEPYRAERLRQFFDRTVTHDLDSSARMQADHVSLAARELLPLFLRVHATDARTVQALALLRGWDGTMARDRAEPLIFEAWLYEVNRTLFAEGLGDPLKEKGPLKARLMPMILSGKSGAWCPKACGDVLREALDRALAGLARRQGEDMTAWRWGREHRAILTHKLFSHVPVLRDVSDLSLPSDGDFYTLDRGGSFVMQEPAPFARRHGGGYRGIYDLSDPARSRFMIATGQSGHIFSPHYGDLAGLWNDVKAVTIAGSTDALLRQGAKKLALAPWVHGAHMVLFRFLWGVD